LRKIGDNEGKGGFMQITLTVPDKKADSFLDVLRHISYVTIQLSDVPGSQPAAQEEEVYEGLKDAIHEVNEAITGRKQLRTVQEFLTELRGENVERI
jgi:hypothetical protein